MKKIICKKEYDTETALLIRKKTSGVFGSSEGYEETLYKTPDGFYFLYTVGGTDSPYPTADIKRMSAKAAEAFLADEGN